MLSPGMLRMLDQVRSEFGVEVEIVDANLAAAWSPEGQRQIRVLAGPELRSVGLGVLREGRSSVVSVDGREYRLVPLRSNRSVLPTALLAMRVIAPAGSPGESDSDRHALDVEPWVEVLRGAIEADLSSREEIDGERQQARAVRGALRFVTYLAAARSEAELADAAIQAAAVWFDADARVYRRRPGGDYALFASLPGAQVPIEGRQLTGLDLGGEPLVRAAHLAGLPGGRDGIVVPIAGADPAQWALVLLGTMPPEAEVTLEALGRVLGVQMERLALGRVDTIRHRFEEIVAGPARAVELTAMDVLRDLIAQAHGTGAALWIAHGDDARRMAAVGEGMSHGDAMPPEQRSTATVQVRTVKLGPSRSARLELRTTGDAPFASDVPQIVDACASVLRGWLAAAVRPEPAAVPLLLEAPAPDFARRIEEELARAKRFDRDLAIVVIDPATRQWPASATNKVVDVLREELRGSDVLGLIGERRVVVLLIETKETGMGTVVERLRQRLGRAMPELKVPALVLGQAAFSRECATADALLTAAAVNAETITVPAA